ncbi:MAG: caspase family protein [Deltaproteobacteria bacterium]|nr:caspase family protein [Deltaproteobacteria bacterium]
MNLAVSVFVPLLLATSAHAQTPLHPPPEDRAYVALVIGLSTYQYLPDEVELDFARSDAAIVAGALRESAHFDRVFLLTDTEATKAGIRDTMRTKVAQLVGPDDVMIVYFVGHGIGADLGLPTILAHDSTLANGQEDGFVLDLLTRDIQTWLKAGTTLVVTDIIHRNQLDGIYFYGPSATQWPPMRPGTMILSSSQSQQPATDGAFGQVFAAAIAGAADRNDDSYVTAGELSAYVVSTLSSQGQVPVPAGNYNGNMILAEGVDRSSVRVGTPAGDPAGISEVYPDVTIDKAKFVFGEGAAQSVQCHDKPIIACDPSCYVWDFKAGPCNVTAVIDGYPMKGRVIILARGKYDCRRKGPELSCLGPG